MPVESLVNKFAHQRFEPMGMTTNSDIPFAKSLVDYIFRWLGMEFVPGYREANAPKRPSVSDKQKAREITPPRLDDKADRRSRRETARRPNPAMLRPTATGPPPTGSNAMTPDTRLR